MKAQALKAFLEKAARNPELQRELMALAGRYGVILEASELTAEELEKVAGGISRSFARVAGESKDRAHKQEIEVLR